MADYVVYARQAAQNAGIDPNLFVAQMKQESGLQPYNADGTVKVSPAGAVGVAQIMPATAQGWGVDPNDPYASLDAAAAAMASYLARYNGSWADALAAYNAGPGAVDKYGGVPPYLETRAYVAGILGKATTTGSTAGMAPAGAGGISGGALALGIGVLVVIWLLGD